MTLKICVITGGNNGIGFEASKKLLQEGYRVIMGCRSTSSAEVAVDKLSKYGQVEYLPLDLANFKSIHEFADLFNNLQIPLHLLILNAGVHLQQRVISEYGCDETLATNHLGHFLLTSLLLPKLKETLNSKILVVSSELHNDKLMQKTPLIFDWDNLDGSKCYDGLLFYRMSKLANMWFALALARRIEGSGVTCNAVSPGFVPTTQLFRSAPMYLLILFKLFVRFLPHSRSIAQGADEYIFAVRQDMANGKYFHELKEDLPSEEARDIEKQEKLWEWSESVTKAKYKF